jgi:hypothetical protein
VAEQYLQAFSQLAKESTTMLLPSNASEPAAMIAQALSIYKGIVGVDGVSTRMSPDGGPKPKDQSSGPWKPTPLDSEKDKIGQDPTRGAADINREPPVPRNFSLQTPA